MKTCSNNSLQDNIVLPLGQACNLNKAGNMIAQPYQKIMQEAFSSWSLLMLTLFEVFVACSAESSGQVSKRYSVSARQEISLAV